MHAARVVQVGLSGTSNQTFILDGRSGVLARNRAAVERLLSGRTPAAVSWAASRWMVRDIPGDRVVDFLQDFAAHPDQRWLTNPGSLRNMQKWIRKWAAGESWNVVLASRAMGRDDPRELGTMTIGGIDLCCLDRSPLRGSTRERLDMKAVLSASDRVADIDPALLGNQWPKDSVAFKRARRLHGQRRGLIVIYPISGVSGRRIRTERSDRIPMPEGENLLAFAIFFPHAVDEQGNEGTFVSSVLEPRDRVHEEVEDDDE